jgi:hypothetical protein
MKTVKLTDEAYALVMSIVEVELEDTTPASAKYVALDDLASQLDEAENAS